MRKASTVATMFQSPTRSTESAMSAGMPHLVTSKSGRDLAADGAGQLHLARDADLGACLAGDRPVAGLGGNRRRRVLRIGFDEGPSLDLGADHEAQVLVEEDRGEQRSGVVDHRAVVDVAADAATLDDCVVVLVGDFRLGYQVTGFDVVPARLGVVLPDDESGVPRQFENACGRELLVDLHLEAGTRGTVRSELTGTDDDHEVRGGRHRVRASSEP